MNRPFATAVLALAVSIGLTSAGCRIELGRLTVVSTKNVELSRIDMARLHVRRGAEGEHSRIFILGLPLWKISLETAVDRMLEAGGGDLATNSVVSYWRWEFLLFGWDTCFVTGDVVNSLERAQHEDFPPATASARESTGPRGVAPVETRSVGGVRSAGQ